MNCIGIIGAMETEVARLKEMMEDVTVVTKASMEFYQGILKGKKAVVVRSGIGKVNAGICAQILADVFQVDALINTGIAGSLNNDINIGDSAAGCILLLRIDGYAAHAKRCFDSDAGILRPR